MLDFDQYINPNSERISKLEKQVKKQLLNINAEEAYNNIRKKANQLKLINRENNKKIVTKIVKRGKSKKQSSTSGTSTSTDNT